MQDFQSAPTGAEQPYWPCGPSDPLPFVSLRWETAEIATRRLIMVRRPVLGDDPLLERFWHCPMTWLLAYVVVVR